MMSRSDALRFILMIGGLLILGYFALEKVSKKYPRFDKVKKVIFGIVIVALLIFLKLGLMK